MADLTVRFLGTGDAVGSGGRFQTCFSLRTAAMHALLDCGASSLVAMKQQGVDPASIDAVLVTHLHGDHFGGIPFLILDAQFTRRTRPLLLLGPPGFRERLHQAMEVLFPGSAGAKRAFELEVRELPERVATRLGDVVVTGYAVRHASGAPAYAVRVTAEDKVLAYSGDTEWTEALLEAVRGADLFICEAYFFEKTVPYHLSYTTLREQRGRIDCQRMVLTHPSADLLARRGEVDPDVAEVADDGLELVV